MLRLLTEIVLSDRRPDTPGLTTRLHDRDACDRQHSCFPGFAIPPSGAIHARRLREGLTNALDSFVDGMKVTLWKNYGGVYAQDSVVAGAAAGQ